MGSMVVSPARGWGDEGMCGVPDEGMYGVPDALCSMLLLWRRSPRSSEGDRGRQADARAHFWAQQRAAYRDILALIDGRTFTVGGRQVLDAETLGEVRQWAARRVAACEARLAARDTDH
jgi:hypothetical protein